MTMEKIFKPIEEETSISYIKVNNYSITPEQLRMVNMTMEEKFEYLDNLVKSLERLYNGLDILK